MNLAAVEDETARVGGKVQPVGPPQRDGIDRRRVALDTFHADADRAWRIGQARLDPGSVVVDCAGGRPAISVVDGPHVLMKDPQPKGCTTPRLICAQRSQVHAELGGLRRGGAGDACIPLVGRKPIGRRQGGRLGQCDFERDVVVIWVGQIAVEVEHKGALRVQPKRAFDTDVQVRGVLAEIDIMDRAVDFGIGQGGNAGIIVDRIAHAIQFR